MYTPLEEAKEEIWKRWNNAELRRRVLEYVGELPDGYGAEPCAVLARYIATPNFEVYRFQEIAKKSGLMLVLDVFPQDKFCSNNSDKYHLGKMKFYLEKMEHHGNETSNVRLIPFHKVDGKPFSHLTTPWGDNFVSFHNQLFDGCFSEIQVVDNSVWIQKSGDTLSEHYCYFLASFICHGILFENFLGEGGEGKFTREIVCPAIKKVTDHFGLKPLIVRLLPEESEADPYWCWYPGHLEVEVQRCLNLV